MSAGSAPNVRPLPVANARAAIRHVFIRDLVLTASIGVHQHEHDRKQRVRINLDLAVSEGEAPLNDSPANVVCYERIADGVRRLVAAGHVNLVETLAENIAEMCLEDDRVRSVRVRAEKLDVLPDAASVGVEIERLSL